MAKRNYLKRSQKNMQPAVQTLTFTGLTVSGLGGRVDHIDLSQVASLVNRRFYRQGINWAVAGFKFTATGGTGSIQINKLPNTWVMSNSWEKSMRTWTKMNDAALAETESVRPRFLDFKIYADENHHNAGYGANLLPVSGAGVPFQPGEWVSSKAVVPFGPASPGNTAEFEFIATGANFPGASAATGLNAVSCIEGYAASRGLPYSPDPNTPADADDADGSTPENWMAAVFNEGTDQTSEVIEDMLFDNNQAPYPFEGDGLSFDTMYPNGANQGTGLQIHDVELVSGTTIGGTTRLKGGNFPCGLIQIVTVNSSEQAINFTLQLDLVPGHHRGYLCEPMTEM
ncbi:MAG: hypothetical protein [Circular genetic element sp.]|nr:MAG: hypothetical protein [Circular genetic element sp.]